MALRTHWWVVAAYLVVDASAYGEPPRDYSGSCTKSGCHDTLINKPIVHEPLGNDACDACHEQQDEKKHTFSFTEEEGELCTQCHDPHEGRVVHSPYGEGMCLECHDPHSSAKRGLIKGPSLGALCMECHDELTDDLTHVHGPVAAGDCGACHDPHVSDNDFLLRKQGRALCLSCHVELQDRLKSLPNKHAPVEQECTSCHNPHGSNQKLLLSDALPQLCYECHDELEEQIDEAKVHHQPLSSKRSCVACHNPHASKAGKLLNAEGSELCLSCHNRAYVRNGREVANMAAMIEAGKSRHGPIDQGDCLCCHEAHAGSHQKLVIAEFPSKFYVPFAEETYSLCFECHDTELVDEEETDEATGFRMGNRNLHFVHVNRDVKGRSCRACHAVHASPNPKLIADTVAFGEWRIPLNFQKTSTGGSCAPGCHRPQTYDRKLQGDPESR